MITITRKQTNLPSTYTKVAEITFAQTVLPIFFGDWITIAMFSSSTRGHIPAFFKVDHDGRGEVKEITKTEFFDLVKKFNANA
jgi:hypothetical protein